MEKAWGAKVINKLFLFLLFIFLISSCSPNYEKLSWLDEYKDFKETSRSVATGDEECFVDQFEISKIKEEIPELEKNFKKKIQLDSSYDFASFKNAETHYIKRFHDYITLNELGKTCSDLPCVLNSAYGRKEGEEGYRIYHWFLTMGSGISTSRKIPGYKDNPKKDLKDYLFPNSELKIFNISSKTLSKKYRDLLISTLHRFPNGTSPGVGIAGLYSYSWSYTSTSTTRNPGTIFFTKQNFNIRDKLIDGYYSNVIFHEHTHGLDFTYGPVNTSKLISAGKKWTDLSWKWGEVTNTYIVKQEDGSKVEKEKTEMKWIPDDTKSEGFLRAYQRTSPAEDFADSGAHFIISPEKFQKKSPKKYEWFKKDFYSNYGTTKDEFVVERSNEIATILKEELWESVKSCLIDKNNEIQEANKVKLNDFEYLDEKSLNCLERTIENNIERELFFIKRDQYLACNYLRTKENLIYENVVKIISPALKDFINKIDDFKEVQKIWSIYREELKTQCDPSHIYIKVRNTGEPELAYSTELAQCIDRIHMKYTTYGELFLDEKQVYLEAHPYNKVEEETLFAFSKMMKGFKTYLERAAEDLVDTCSIIKDEKLETEGPVYGNGVFVNAGVLNCINNEFNKSLDEQLYEFLENKYSLNQESLLYLTEQYSKQYIDFVNQELHRRNKTEYAIYQSAFVENRQETFAEIFTDKEHLGELYKSKDSVGYCQLHTSMIVTEKIKSIWEKQGWPLTISLNETSNNVIDLLCPELIQKANDEYQIELESIDAKIEEFFKLKLKSTYLWIDGLDNEENFIPVCTENYTNEAKSFANGIMSSNRLYFINGQNLTRTILQELCKKLETRFKSQIDKIQGQSKIYSKSILKILEQDLLWQVVPNKDKYINSCMLNAQLKIDRSFVESNENLQKFDLVSPQLISKYLASNACEQKYKLWVKIDLPKLRNIISNDNPTSYIISLDSNKIWQQYMLKFYSEVLLDLDQKVQEDFDKAYARCKKKYPYVRFAPMKLNRKKCLIEYFDKASLKEYSNGKFEPLVEEAILEAGRLKLDLLQKKMSEYLK